VTLSMACHVLLVTVRAARTIIQKLRAHGCIGKTRNPGVQARRSLLSLSPMSALRRITDSSQTLRQDRKVPEPEVISPYSITSAATSVRYCLAP
jgi:hypothetical protein